MRSTFSRPGVGAIAVFAGLLVSAPAQAVSNAVEREMATLLRAIETSSCAFYRNGSRYSGRIAAWHLRGRFDDVRERIGTSEDFIADLAATSETSGERYAVECGGQRESGEAWLRERLANVRRAQAAR
jgi:Family of unknown function (DUF5329)